MSDTFQRRHYIDAMDACAGIERKALAREVLKNDQDSKPPIVEELIGDEVHAPAFVAHRSCGLHLPFDTGNAPTRRFPTHYEAFLTIEAVDPLVVDLPAFTLQEDVETTIAIGDPS